jgi:pyruvate,water dikinase
MAHVFRLTNHEIDRSTAGGKAMSLHQLHQTGADVPDGFTVTTQSYRDHLEKIALGDVDRYLETGDLGDKSAELREEILNTSVPSTVSDRILQIYDDVFAADDRVAVRSSATAEDMDDASFAGQQDTYLNVQREDLIERVTECWASLFTKRACVYRERNDISHEDAEMAVVVQEMVDATVSGVLFTSDPVSGDDEMTIESAWGLGEGVVSGEVTPDRFVVDGDTGDLLTKDLSTKRQQYTWNGDETELIAVPEDKQDARTLTDDQIQTLWTTAQEITEYYGEPQDIEWAIHDDELYILQSRPITSITSSATADTETGVIVEGLGASPGTAAGTVRLIEQIDETDRVTGDDILVTAVTTPDMVPAMQRAAAVVTDEGGMTSHAAIVSRELGVPSVVGTNNATERLTGGQEVTVDGDKGVVTAGADDGTEHSETDDLESLRPETPVTPMTATDIKVNVSLPQAAERGAATGADGVGLLRLEHLILGLEQTPTSYIEEHGENAFVNKLVEGIQTVADEFYARPVRIRTLDAPTDEFRKLQGGESEPVEDNPMLGHRGIRRSLETETVFRYQLKAFQRLREVGYDNVEIMFPLVNDADDVDTIMDIMADVGIDTAKTRWGVMIETPAAALEIESITDRPVDFVSFGTNDLTQYTLAVDRNNERVSDRFDETHDAVLTLIEDVIEVCRAKDVDTSICGEAASKPTMIRQLIESGVTSLSVNIDAVRDTQHEVKRREQRLLLDTALDEQSE